MTQGSCYTQWESQPIKLQKNSYKDLTAFFTPPKYVDQNNMNEKNMPQWLIEGSTT